MQIMPGDCGLRRCVAMGLDDRRLLHRRGIFTSLVRMAERTIGVAGNSDEEGGEQNGGYQMFFHG